MAPGTEHYHPKDSVKAGIQGTLIVGTAGLAIAAVQNTLTKRNYGAMGVIRRGGGTIANFAAVGGAYEFVKLASANLRERDDSINTAIGGFVAGSVMGLRHGTIPAILGFGALSAVVLGAYDYTGGVLTGYKKDPEVDDFERKQALRMNRRRPIEETLSEIGEGRGIRPPGYAERRAARIKENYGFDVPVKP